VFQFGVCTKNGYGIHISGKLTEGGAGLGVIFFLQWPKAWLSFVLLFFSLQFMFGDIREERNAVVNNG
jgi:hypothetical protein